MATIVAPSQISPLEDAEALRLAFKGTCMAYTYLYIFVLKKDVRLYLINNVITNLFLIE